MLRRDEWFDLARKLDWDFDYVSEREIYPEAMSGRPWLPQEAWAGWDEPYRTSYREYVGVQHKKEASVRSVEDAVGRLRDFKSLSPEWLNGLKLHAATLPLAEFAATIGNLRAARFGRDGAWRTLAVLGALDELRHTQIPLTLLHKLVPWDSQFDWTHKFFHSNNWVAIAGRHLADELLLTPDPIEFAISTNFVFETGFTNLQFIGLSAIASEVGDRMFEKMIGSIQTDEARHAQIGPAVLEILVRHDREYAQYLADKWFWRSWLFFAIVTGFTMDYLTPLAERKHSFKEFMEEWVLGQFLRRLEDFGLRKPWYWGIFLDSLENYHHMVYASAYTYRATVWFNMVMPGPAEHAWLRDKYPDSWPSFEPVWKQIAARWRERDIGNDLGVHGFAIVGFCNLCQLVLCGGNPERNAAIPAEINGVRYIFCSEPCRWIFEHDLTRYSSHKDVVKRVLAGEAPGNLLAILTQYFGLTRETWGKDVHQGDYPWLERTP